MHLLPAPPGSRPMDNSAALRSPAPGYPYDAFASHATDPDGPLVRVVEALLEGFHRRPYLRTEYAHEIELCVDGRDFVFPKRNRNRNDGLDAIEPVVRAYQKRSRSLIIFCGPESRNHRWIDKEIQWWIEDRPKDDPIYFALTHGADPEAVANNMPPNLLKRGGSDNVVFFDLRGFYLRRGAPFQSSSRRTQLHREAADWKSVRDFDEEVAKLAANLVSDSTGKAIAVSDLIAAYAESDRREKRRRRVRRVLVASIVTVAAATGGIVSYRVEQTQERRTLASEAQAAIDDQQYERAMRIGVQGLPVRGEFPWALRWSDPETIALESKLAGAAQLSALIAQFRANSKEQTISPNEVSSKRKLPGNFTYAAFSPDGKRIVGSNEDGTAQVWDIETRQPGARCKEQDVVPPDNRPLHWLWSSRFSPDGQRIVTASYAGLVWVWDANGADCGKPILLKGASAAVRSAAFSPNGDRVITASEDGHVRIFDAYSGALCEPPLAWQGQKLTNAEFSPDGKSIAVSSTEGLVAIRNLGVDGNVRVLKASSHTPVWSVRFSRDSKRLMTAAADGSVVVYDADSGDVVSSLPRQTLPVNSADFSSDGHRIVTASADNTARVWNIEQPSSVAELFVFKGHSRSVRHVEFSPDGKRIATASSDQTVRIWDAATNVTPILKKVHQDAVRTIEFSPDGQLFVTASDDKTARTWKVEAGAIHKLDGDPISVGGSVTSAAFSPDAERIIVTATDGKITLWDLRTKSEAIFYAGKGTAAASAKFSPNGELIAASSEAEGLQLWNLQTKEHSLFTDVRGIRSVEFSANGQTLLTGANNGRAQLWGLKSNAVVMSYNHGNGGVIESAHFSTDGTRIVTASSDRTARIWNTSTGRELLQLRGHGGDVYGARFSIDGTRVVTASGDHKVRVWDTDTGTQIVRFTVGGDPFDAAFTRNGDNLIVALDDGSIEAFDVRWIKERRENLVRRVCKEKLVDVMKFTPDDNLNPVLSGFGENNPCERTGPLRLFRVVPDRPFATTSSSP
jgi:WD40 repeat protein